MSESREILPSKASVLPDLWVTEIFRRLELSFGSRFSNLWRNVSPTEMRAHWAGVLGGFVDRPEAIKAALEACQSKDDPPTPGQFLEHCRSYLRSSFGGYQQVIQEPEISQEAIAARSRQLESVARKPDSYDYKGWAKHLRSEYLAGVVLLPMQVSMASEALGEVWEKRNCVPRQAAA